jgi:hypothetical protein
MAKLEEKARHLIDKVRDAARKPENRAKFERLSSKITKGKRGTPGQAQAPGQQTREEHAEAPAVPLRPEHEGMHGRGGVGAGGSGPKPGPVERP